MDEETFKLFCDALDEPTVDSVKAIYLRLKELIIADGYDFPKDPLSTFLETIHVDGRPAQIRHSYM